MRASVERIIHVSLIVLVVGLTSYVGYCIYETLKPSLSEPEFQASIPGSQGKEAEKDCGCTEASNSNHYTQNEASRKLQGMTDLVVERYAEST